MKKNSSLLVMAIAICLSACNNASTKNNNAATTISLDTNKLKSGELFYQCEMDADVISNKADTCAKCGMDLEKIVKK